MKSHSCESVGGAWVSPVPSGQLQRHLERAVLRLPHKGGGTKAGMSSNRSKDVPQVLGGPHVTDVCWSPLPRLFPKYTPSLSGRDLAGKGTKWAKAATKWPS